MTSDVSETETFKKVHSKDRNRTLRMKITWTESYFTLTVMKETNAWTTHVTLEQVNKQANALEMNLKEYYKKLEAYFFNAPQDVTFDITKNELNLLRTVNGGMTVKYFSAPLKKVNYTDTVELILDELHDKNLSLEGKLEGIEKEKLEVLRDKEKCENKLKEFVDAKERHDKQLLSNFVLLLNEKKKRIQHLTDMLDVYKTNKTLPDAPHNVLITKKKRSKKKITDVDDQEDVKMPVQENKQLEALSASDSEEYKTDDDTDDEKSVKKGAQSGVLNENEPIPGTSKDSYNFLFEDDATSSAPTIGKRIKVEMPNKTFEVNMDERETTNGPTKKLNNNNSKVEKMAVDEHSPVLDFNTQDLLDRM